MDADAAFARAALMLGEAQAQRATSRPVDRAAAVQAAKDFEAVFLSQMLAPMFAELGDDPLFGSGPGEAIFKSLLIDEFGKAMANTGGLGLHTAVLGELLKSQEIQ